MTSKLDRRDSKLALWDRIRDYKFDDLVPPHLGDKVKAMFGGPDASTRAFADKIARKLGWDSAFALRAIGEYRRFVYLGIISDFYVTPPKTIDQVWHEHLLFSRGYRDFCKRVLKTDFDHAPELLPSKDQTSVYQSQYEATLALYSTEFNQQAPSDIWGSPKFLKRLHQPVEPPKKREEDTVAAGWWGDVPLYSMWADSDRRKEDGGWHAFAGDGGSTGGGAWVGHDSQPGHFHGDGHAHSHGLDASHDSGGDSGGSDGGGGGCSSGCGGGGCGGGGD